MYKNNSLVDFVELSQGEIFSVSGGDLSSYLHGGAHLLCAGAFLIAGVDVRIKKPSRIAKKTVRLLNILAVNKALIFGGCLVPQSIAFGYDFIASYTSGKSSNTSEEVSEQPDGDADTP